MSRDRERYQRWIGADDRDPDLRPAATAMVLRDSPDGLQVLMVRHTRSERFVSGVWAFPGGQVEEADVADAAPDTDPFGVDAGRRAAARETAEEVDLRLEPASLEPWSYWIPPPVAPRRYATWFFVAVAPGGDVTPDGDEITDHRWIAPAEALRRRTGGDMEFLPPTYVSLDDLSSHPDAASVLDAARRRDVPTYRTNLQMLSDGAVAMWEGDAGWENGDPGAAGRRHRLWMRDAGWRFEKD